MKQSKNFSICTLSNYSNIILIISIIIIILIIKQSNKNNCYFFSTNIIFHSINIFYLLSKFKIKKSISNYIFKYSIFNFRVFFNFLYKWHFVSIMSLFSYILEASGCSHVPSPLFQSLPYSYESIWRF